MPHRIQTEARAAASLVQLLVVIAVVGILLALLVPAAQKTRQAAQRAVCAHNFKQIGQAFHAHQDKHGVFPDAGDSWTDGRSKRPDGMPEVTPNQDWGCWYQILPYHGYDSVWSSPDDQVVAAAIIPIYFCPARRAPVGYPGVETPNLPVGGTFKRGALDYAGSGGNVLPAFPGGDNRVRKNGAIVPRFNVEHVNTLNIADGASNTLLASERNFNLKRAGDWSQYDENNGYFNGWDWDTMRWAHESPAPDRYDDSYYDLKFGSSHFGGLNCLLADGSVRFLLYGVDLTMFQRLCDRADGEALSIDIWR